MRKHYIIVAVVVVALAAALFSVWQFYFKDKLQAYSKDLARKEKLVAKLDSLSETFSGVRPEVIVEIWQGAEMPWNDAVRDRAEYFNVEEKISIDDIPEEGILKFYYEDQLNQRIQELRQEAYNQQVPIPYVLYGAPSVESLRNTAPNRLEVLKWLQMVDHGCAVTRLLLKARPLGVSQIELWPQYDYQRVLVCHTVGVKMRITLANLLDFIQDLSHDRDRYYSINEIQIQNRQLQSFQDPPLDVSLIFTQATYKEPTERDRTALASMAATTLAGGALDAQEQFARLRQARGEREDDRGKRKRKSWFRKYFWPFDWP